MVALDGRDQDQAAVGEHRCVDVVVGEVAAAVVRVVADEDVARAELLFTEIGEGEADRQRARQHELGDAHREGGEAPLAVEDRAVALVGLVEDGRGGGATDVGRHLPAHRLHRPPDDLGGDGVDGGAFRQLPPVSGELDQIDVHWLSPP